MVSGTMKFSILMAVWSGERPAHLEACLESLAAQTLPADEIVIVKDGPLGEGLEGVLRSWERKAPLNLLALERNEGLGEALRRGVERCRFDVIARMDTDDIALPRRFELQMRYLASHTEVDVVGGQIREFDLHPATARMERRVPGEHEAIGAMARRRNPMNHMTATFRREAVLAAGNYQSFHGFEDYELWVRMLRSGAHFHNLDEVVVLTRCGSAMQQRRGGWAYLKREAGLMWEFRRMGFLTTGEAVRNVAWRAPARLAPASWRRRLYHRFLRSRGSGEVLIRAEAGYPQRMGEETR